MPVSANVEIAASPESVRAKFLDFSNLPTYHTTFFISITPLGPLSPGQKIRVVFGGGMKMDGSILANEPQLFKWRGSLPYVFTGDHGFHFAPSTITPGGTTFTQEEAFSAALGFLMGDNVVGRWCGFGSKTEGNWDEFNRDLKKACEADKYASW